MFGRRKAANSEKFISLAERVRQRALGDRAAITQEPANIGRFTGRDRRNAAAERPQSQPTTRRRAAKVLSFHDTPVYRIAENGAIKTTLLNQVLAVLEDRLDCVPYLDGSRATLAAAVDELIDEVAADLELLLGREERRALVVRLLDELAGLGPLEMLLADDTVSEIAVEGHDRVFVERRGRRQLTDIAFRGEGHLLQIARRIALGAGRRLDEGRPMASVRLPGGHRARVTVPPMVAEGASISIRRRAVGAIPLHRMVRTGCLSRDMATVLALAVATRQTILIAGAGGSGRTTLLNALLETADPGERLVAVEAFTELRLPGRRALRLEARPAGAPGRGGEVSQRHLLQSALKMRPDRIVLGEIEGGEAPDLLAALDSGQRGAMATIHADSPEEALRRLEALLGAGGAGAVPLACRRHIARAIDLVVQVERLGDGTRRVTRLTEMVGVEGDTFVTRDLFAFEQAGEDGDGRIRGRFRETGAKPAFTERTDGPAFGAPLDGAF